MDFDDLFDARIEILHVESVLHGLYAIMERNCEMSEDYMGLCAVAVDRLEAVVQGLERFEKKSKILEVA